MYTVVRSYFGKGSKELFDMVEKNKVDVQCDFLGNSLLTTAAAEDQSRTGHDIFTLANWEINNHAHALEPVDDVVKRLSDKYGQPNAVAEYLGKLKGHWMGVPCSQGSQAKGPCGRISILKRRHGLRRCPYKGDHGMRRWVGLGVIADNLQHLGVVLGKRKN